jgi:hypothetical protein
VKALMVTAQTREAEVLRSTVRMHIAGDVNIRVQTIVSAPSFNIKDELLKAIDNML